MITELEPNLFRIYIPSKISFIKPPLNLYLFAGENALLWDAGYGNKRESGQLIRAIKKIEKIMKERGRDFKLEKILISHAHGDHFAGLKILRKKTGAKVLLTSAMAAKLKSRKAYQKSWEEPPHLIRPMPPGLLRFLIFVAEWLQNKVFGLDWIEEPDLIIPESGILNAGGRIISYFPIPGHANDHLALYIAAEKILLSGDHLLRSMTTWLGPPGGSIEDYEKSLEKLKTLDIKRIFPAHGSPIEEPEKHIEAAIKHSKRRTERVVKLVKEAGSEGISLYRLLRRLYPFASPVIRLNAEGWVLLTLRMLVKEKKIRARYRGYKWLFYI